MHKHNEAKLTLFNRQAVIGKKPVIVYYSFEGKDFRHLTNVKVSPENWSKSKSRVLKKEASEEVVNDFNTTITNELERVNDIIDLYINAHGVKPPVSYLREQVKHYRKKKVVEKSFMDYYDEFMVVRMNDKNIAKGTHKDFESLRRALKEFVQDWQHPLTFETACQYYPFGSDFINFLIEVRDQNNKTINKRLSCLKQFLTYAKKKHKIQINEVELESFRVENHSPDFVVISKDELKAVKDIDLSEMAIRDIDSSNKNYFEEIRDYFIVLSYTGMRYSDLITLSKEHLINNAIDKIAVKTKARFRVGMNKFVQELVNKYKCKFNKHSNQKFNAYLKELFKYLADNHITTLNESFVYTKWQGKEAIKINYRRWQDVSTHTGRRSFITLAIERGEPVNKIMDMTGHKKLDTLFIYLKRFSNYNTDFVDSLIA